MTDPTVVPEAPAQPQRRSRAEIAKEMFGSEYHGEAKAPEPEPKPVEETEEPKPVDAQTDEKIPPEVEPAEGEEPKEGEEPAPTEDTGEMPIATVSELVEHLESSPEWFNGLKMSFNVDGMPTEATIKELVDSYQLRGAAEHRLEKAKDFNQKQHEVLAAKHAELDTHFQVLAELIKQEDDNLEREVKAVDPNLRDRDPAEWAARTQEFQQRRAQIAQIKIAAVEKWKTVAEQRAVEAENIKNEFMAEQRKVLLEKIPEWQDPQKADTEKAEIANYLVQLGWQPQELSGLIDHRQVMVARKAMLYDKSRGQVDTAKKKVAKVPRIMKPGAPKPAEQRAAERIQGLKDRLDKTGNIDDAIAYRLAKRGVSR